jgi:hypothetical protein
MSLMPTAPRSIGGVLDDAIRLYRKTLFPCFPLLLVAVVLSTAVGVWVTLTVQPIATAAAASTDPWAAFDMFTAPGVWLAYLVLMLVFAIVYGALFYQIDALARGQRPSLGDALGLGLKRLPVMLGVGILFFIMLVVGLVLLVIPGIWLWGVFQLAFVAAVIERTGVFASFGVSRNLVRGNWWRVNVVIFVAFVLLMVVLLVIGAIAGFIMAATGSASAVMSPGGQAIQQVISGVLNLFTLSFYPCVLLAVYNDLKLRREGADLADRVGALTPAG